MKKSAQLGRNIKSLRIAYGETQLELSLILDLESPNTIANYEKGERFPKPEIIKKIAVHYQITVDELVNSNILSFKIPVLQINNKDKMNEIAISIFPVIYTEKAIEDSLFRKGYEAHSRCIEAMKAGYSFSEIDYAASINNYLESYDNYKTSESMANLLWWLLISEIGLRNGQIAEGIKLLNNQHITNERFIKQYYLKDPSDENESGLLRKDLQELNESIIEILKELKKDIQYTELVDYYIALRYLLGCIDNELTKALNKTVGEEMMLSFAQLGNKYAKQFILQGMKNLLK